MTAASKIATIVPPAADALVIPPIKSSADLRRFLCRQMQSVLNGTIDFSKSKAITNLAQQIYNTMPVEQRAAALRAKEGITTIDAVKFDPEEDGEGDDD